MTLDYADLHDNEPCAGCAHPRFDHRFTDPKDSPSGYVYSHCTAEEHVQPYSPLGGLADDHMEPCRCASYAVQTAFAMDPRD